jgi:hypothetical protein
MGALGAPFEVVMGILLFPPNAKKCERTTLRGSDSTARISVTSFPVLIGRARGSRTPDLLNAIQ